MVSCLLEAGYPINATKKGTMEKSTMDAITWGMVAGRIENLDAIVKQRPGAIDFTDAAHNDMGWGNLLHMATWMVDTGKQRLAYDWLKKHNAITPLMNKRCMMGVTPFGYLGINLDATAESVTELIKMQPGFFKADMHRVSELPLPLKVMMTVMKGFSGVSTGAADIVRLFQFCITGGTVFHDACWLGNLELIQVLIELGADPTMRCPKSMKGHGAAGLTPYEIVLLKWNGTATQTTTAALLEAHGHGACVTEASAHVARAAKLQRKAGRAGRAGKAAWRVAKKQSPVAVLPVLSAEP